MTRHIVAYVKPPSFADYVVIIDNPGQSYSIGADATFNGKVHANGSVDNAGVVAFDDSDPSFKSESPGLLQARANGLPGEAGNQKILADLHLSEGKYEARKWADFEDLPIPAAIDLGDLPCEIRPDRFPEEIEFFNQSILLHF